LSYLNNQSDVLTLGAVSKSADSVLDYSSERAAACNGLFHNPLDLNQRKVSLDEEYTSKTDELGCFAHPDQSSLIMLNSFSLLHELNQLHFSHSDCLCLQGMTIMMLDHYILTLAEIF